MKLGNFDLNLLVTLHVVLGEGSITRAAKRLNRSQPAVSQALARARDLFADELLLRDGTSMTLTPLARRLLPQLDEFCSRAEGLVSKSAFSPKEARIDFTICANDLTELLILPALISTVAREAPGCRIIVRTPEPFLVNATIDLAIIGAPVPAGPFGVRELYEDHFVMLARADHPAIKGDLAAEAFAALPQALVSPTGQDLVGPIDFALEELGLTRRVALSVTRFTTLPQIIASTDLIAAVPSRYAARTEVQALCQVRPLPFASPRFTMKMVWHRMHETDPAHVWLRSLL